MKVKNLGKMYAKIAAMPAAVKEEIRKALAQSAEEIVDLQKRFVPVDHGDLRDSITWQYGDAKRIKHSQTIGASGDHELSVRISAGNARVRYAHLVEFPTRAHIAGGKFKGARHPGTKAQPFFYPGFRLGKKRAKSRIVRATNRAVKRVASR